MNLNYQVLNVCAQYLNGLVNKPVLAAQLILKNHKDELNGKQRNLLFSIIWTAGSDIELTNESK